MDGKKILRNCLWGLLITGQSVLNMATAETLEWAPKLVKPEKGYFSSADAIRMEIPELPLEVLQNLALEIDDIDVTNMVDREGKYATYNPQQPLSRGKHTVRVVEYAASGDIIERASWIIDVRKTEAFREADLIAQLEATISQRIADKNVDNEDDGSQGSSDTFAEGGAVLAAAIADDNWRFNGNAQMIYHSDEEFMPQNRKLDLATFLVTAKTGIFTARAGHHMPVPDSLISSAFNRRGASLSLGTDNKLHSVTAFALRSNEIIGFQKGLGIGDKAMRANGLTFSTRPVSSKPELIVLSGTFMDGEMDEVESENTGGEQPLGSSKATSIVAESLLLNNRLRLRGELANSKYDQDGGENVFDEEDDDAYSVLITYTPNFQLSLANKPVDFTFGVQQLEIGTFFKSLANPTLVSDRNLLRGFTAINWSSFNVEASYGTETNNVNNLKGLGETETEQNVVTIVYSPVPVANANGSASTFNWLGRPAIALNYNQTGRRITEASTTWSKGRLSETEGGNVSLQFTRDVFNWGIGYGWNDHEDLVDLEPDTRETSISFVIQWLPVQQLMLGINLNQGEVENVDTDVTSENELLNISVHYQVTQNATSVLEYSVEKDAVPGDQIVSEQDTETSTVNIAIAWNVRETNAYRPGLTISLEGAYQDFEDKINPELSTDAYQVFLRINAGWAPYY